MTYWDSSALVALYVSQASSDDVRDILELGGRVYTWTLSDVEIRSALARLERERIVSEEMIRQAREEAEFHWQVIELISLLEPVKLRAKRLLGIHAIRAGDALQLGAALIATHDDPTGHSFISLDTRLSSAARREGFSVLP
ncbi:MAG: type II toxin-antitoxin system VapC family toxin [Candidatus Eisenbacteria bacterium]|nr:type II toxin-antitoxin system VapC family toxin [Candidatus Eisenbacteria bacterium]